MKILGINSVYHESSAAILVDGILEAAVEEERFNRIKHGTQALVENPDELPVYSIRYCLENTGIKPNDIDAICYSFDPELRRKHFFTDPFAKQGDWGSNEGEATFMKGLYRVREKIESLLGVNLEGKFFFVPHHLAHAASSYYPSGFNDAAILVIDGIGEYSTTLIARGCKNKIEPLKTLLFPHSLGFFWEKICKYLGFSEYDACKVMGLAGYGNPKVFSSKFRDIIQISPSGFSVNDNIVKFREPELTTLEHILGAKRNNNGEKVDQRYIDIAAQLQDITNKIILNLADIAQQFSRTVNLCVAGGVGLNCCTNWILKEKSSFDNLYISPSPHDAGTAPGAAMYHYFHTLGKSVYSGRARRFEYHSTLSNPYTGPEFSDSEIIEAIKKSGTTHQFLEKPEQLAAKLISEGKIIGWFQGRMEFGPRALGNRSLIADPRNPYMREIINKKIKHREHFRPFAPSVLEEKASKWFELGKASESYKYMLFACPALEHCKTLLPSIVHVDGTSRVQLVSKQNNNKFYSLICEFEKLTGVPVVLNTSFNDSEPIVCSPKDAINTFFKTKMDALFIGNFLLTHN